MPGQDIGDAGGGMPYHNRVDFHRFEIPGRTQDRLPLGKRTAACGDIDRIGREPFGGEFEGRAGPRRVLEKEHHDRLPAQGRHLFDIARGNFLKRLGRFQDKLNLLAAQVLRVQKILMGPFHHKSPFRKQEAKTQEAEIKKQRYKEARRENSRRNLILCIRPLFFAPLVLASYFFFSASLSLASLLLSSTTTSSARLSTSSRTTFTF